MPYDVDRDAEVLSIVLTEPSTIFLQLGPQLGVGMNGPVIAYEISNEHSAALLEYLSRGSNRIRIGHVPGHPRDLIKLVLGGKDMPSAVSTLWRMSSWVVGEGMERLQDCED